MGDLKCINLVSKQGLHVWSKKGKEMKRKKKMRRKEKQIQGMELWIFVWKLNLSMEIMDFSMILVQELLGYGLLGFQLDINLVPVSRVLLGKHSNSRFKGSLVEKP